MPLQGNVTVQMANREVLRRVNREISLSASRFANALLSGIFRAIFHVERSYEFTEPEAYELEHEPDRILWGRLGDYWTRHLPLAIANEQVLAARYQKFTEYDFIIVADVSHSMMLRWWGVYGGAPIRGQTVQSLYSDVDRNTWRTTRDKTKLFLLKYTIASFLHAAQANEFSSVVLLCGGDQIESYESRKEPNIENSVLERIDAHYARLAAFEQVEWPRICEGLRRVLERRRKSIVLCISDFLDTLQHVNEGDGARMHFDDMIVPLAEIAAHHRLLVLRINDTDEVNPSGVPVTPNVKNSAYLNGEIETASRAYAIGEKSSLEHVRRVMEWKDGLAASIGRYGIRDQQIVAQHDGEQVDRRIYELGAETWG